MPWLEIHINTRREDAVRYEYALIKAEALSVTLQDNADQPIFEPALGETPLWNETRVVGLFDAEVDTREIEEKLKIRDDVSFKWHIVEDKDWEREWMDNYHPIQCTENLWICPSWCSPPFPEATNLILDPGLAFGTGTHPTTFLCLQWLAEQALQDFHVIDYGCGSGILGVCSLLLGAKQVTGIDIDPQALIASRDNTLRNGLSIAQFPVFLPEHIKTQSLTADLLIANILAGPLVELTTTLIALLKPGGKLCLSGILAEQEALIKKAYASDINFEPSAEKEGWIRLSGTKR